MGLWGSDSDHEDTGFPVHSSVSEFMICQHYWEVVETRKRNPVKGDCYRPAPEWPTSFPVPSPSSLLPGRHAVSIFVLLCPVAMTLCLRTSYPQSRKSLKLCCGPRKTFPSFCCSSQAFQPWKTVFLCPFPDFLPHLSPLERWHFTPFI